MSPQPTGPALAFADGADDQTLADRDEAAGVQHVDKSSDGTNGYARTRRARSQSAHERDVAARSRTQTALVRDEAATHRDQMATERDAGARARDDLAETIDADIARHERERSAEHVEPLKGSEILRRAAGDRERAAASRTLAAEGREAADRDRDLAAADRELAARDRRIAAEELAAEGIDILTGAMRRRVGLAAIQRELDRTSRSGESLVVAFVDVDGLKSINDTVGHPAGDELLREVVSAITQYLRSYDVIARFGATSSCARSRAMMPPVLAHASTRSAPICLMRRAGRRSPSGSPKVPTRTPSTNWSTAPTRR